MAFSAELEKVHFFTSEDPPHKVASNAAKEELVPDVLSVCEAHHSLCPNGYITTKNNCLLCVNDKPTTDDEDREIAKRLGVEPIIKLNLPQVPYKRGDLITAWLYGKEKNCTVIEVDCRLEKLLVEVDWSYDRPIWINTTDVSSLRCVDGIGFLP